MVLRRRRPIAERRSWTRATFQSSLGSVCTKKRSHTSCQTDGNSQFTSCVLFSDEHEWAWDSAMRYQEKLGSRPGQGYPTVCFLI